MTVELRPGPHVELLGVLNEYPQVAVAGGVQLELGDAYAGERRRIVFAFNVPHLASLGPASVAELVIRHVSVGEQIAQHELTVPVVVNAVSASEAASVAPDPEVREEVLVLKAARARDEAIRFADAGHHAAARRLLDERHAELSAAGLVAEAAELLDAAELVSAQRYDAVSRKQLHYRSQQSRRGRP